MTGKEGESKRKKGRTLTHESNTSENNYTNLKGTVESCRNYYSQGWLSRFQYRIRQSVKRSTGTILHIQSNIVLNCTDLAHSLEGAWGFTVLRYWAFFHAVFR